MPEQARRKAQVKKELRTEALKALAEVTGSANCMPMEREFFVLGFVMARMSQEHQAVDKTDTVTLDLFNQPASKTDMA